MAKRNRRRTTSINKHKRYKNKLLPPMATLPNLEPAPWIDERLPEMLWCALLISELPRNDALPIFHSVADFVSNFGDSDDSMDDISHTGLSRVKEDQLVELINLIAPTSLHKDILSPLLLLKELPALGIWQSVLNTKKSESKWNNLAQAVGLILDHQSQEATDCRWVRILCMLSSGKITIPPEQVYQIAYYPNYGDMRIVRPTIRALEISFANEFRDGRDWSTKFWKQCLLDSQCHPLPSGTTVLPKTGTTIQQVKSTYKLLIQHSLKTRQTTSIDARHDVAFGYGFFTLGIIQELLQVGTSQLIAARFSLRSIVESLITIAYLATKDDPELWKSYRVYGSGQAKLSMLKLDEIENETTYVDVNTLRQLSNEDMWEEFLPIDIGHWAKLDTRKMSEIAGVKDFYDQYYSWTSTYTHSHWGAIRDSIYDTCGNPLHRLHRIPRESPRNLPDVLPDACKCVDKILEIISTCYPDFPHRISI